MSELFDTTGVPDDAEHWDGLARRVASGAARRSAGSGLHWLAHSRAGWVAASLLVAVALLSMVWQRERTSARSESAEWRQALAPADEVGRAIVLPDSPPAIGVLLLSRPRGW